MSPEQEAFIKRNVQKPANIEQWSTIEFMHIDWATTPRFVIIEPERGIESDESRYTFEGVAYKPASATFNKPADSGDSTGKATLTIARAATELKKLMRSITPQNAIVPISSVIRIYQTGVTLPVQRFDFVVSKDYPKISGQDIQINMAKYNPSTLISGPQYQITTENRPELRNA